MPYLRLFLRDQQLDEVYISYVFINSIIGQHIIEEEKKKLLAKHKKQIGAFHEQIFFTLDKVSQHNDQVKETSEGI